MNNNNQVDSSTQSDQPIIAEEVNVIPITTNPVLAGAVPIRNSSVTSLYNENNLQRSKAYQYCKTLKCICLIELFFSLFNAMIYWPLIFNSLLILFGYLGISKYNSIASFSYGFYLTLSILGYVALFWYINTISGIFFNSVLIILNIWIFKLLCNFITILRNLNSEDLNELKDGWSPIVHRIILI